ncbi:MAG: hydantoinase B/oxoprolinase family protein [Chloroflexi bacterium]|nr:hydantoinase B/oxoprolinase family protein [Chloroflexota bacterium]
MSPAYELKTDPVTFEVLQHRLWQITKEMGITLTRVTGSPISMDAKDYAAGLFRADGDLIMMSCGVLFHAVTIPYGIKHILKNYSENPGIADGDVFIINDPYICSVHAPDIYLVSPIFHQGKLVAWAGMMTHLVDTGSMDPGGINPRATEVFQEGFRFPGLKIAERGEIRQDIWDSVLNLVRDPGMVGLDLRGEIAAARVARERLSELIAEYGTDAYEALADDVIKYAEMKMRARISEFPDGSWQTRIYYDEDGMTDTAYQVVIKMTKEGDSLTFDLTGTSQQAPSFVNCGVLGAAAAVFGSVAPLMAFDVPWNQGVVNALTVVSPPGTLVNPRFPAPCSLGTVGAARAVMSAVQGLIAAMFITRDDYADDFTAMWGAAIGTVSLAGTNQFGTYAVNMLMDAVGFGAGARSYADGVNTGGSLYIPEITLPNAETYELNLPILYLFRREATDTGGPGKWRGGATLEYALALHDAPQGRLHVGHSAWGTRAPVTSGVFGGYPAANLWLALMRDSDIQDRMRSGTVPHSPDGLNGRLEVPRGNGVTYMGTCDVLWLTSYGGGGYGDPLDREPDLVRRDVTSGLVSAQAASDVYGVTLVASPLAVDYPGTESRRAQIRRTRLDVGTVGATGRSPWSPSPGGHSIQPGGLRVHEYLEVVDRARQGYVVCRKCGHELCIASEDYKAHAVASSRPPGTAGPRHRCTGQFVMREFYCPGCATLLDVEVCVDGAPPVRTTWAPPRRPGQGGRAQQAAR